MPNQKPCVYLLYDDDYKIYIGKTKNLSSRLHTHRSYTNTSMSRLLNKDFNCIILFEDDDISVINNLEMESFDICKKLYGNNLLNKVRPMNTSKDYYNQNKVEILQKSKIYRQVNKQYFQDYYKSNIQNSHTCDVCKTQFSKYRYNKHISTKKHIENLNNNLTQL